MSLIQCVSPIDGSIYAERETASEADIHNALSAAALAQSEWKRRPVAERQALCGKAVDAFVARKAEIALELCWQMGRLISQAPGEVAKS